MAATVAAADPAPPNPQPNTPVAYDFRRPGAPPCDAPPVPGLSPYNIYCPPAVPGVPTPGQPPVPAPDQTTAPSAEPPSVSIAPESSGLALSGESVALALPNMAGSLGGVSYITTIFGRQTLLSQTSRQTFPAQFLVLA